MTTLREDALNESKVYYVALVTGHRTWTTRERPIIGLSGILEFTDTHAIKLACLNWSFGLRSRGLEGFPGESLSRKKFVHSHLLQSQPEGGSMDILAHLKGVRDRTAFELGRLEAAISALSGLSGSRSKSINSTGTRRKMSASARRKISLAQKARWAKQNSISRAKPKRKISAAGRRRIAAAQRARWAKVKGEKKAA